VNYRNVASGGAASELHVTRLQGSETTLIGEMDYRMKRGGSMAKRKPEYRLHIPAVHRPNEEGRHLSPKET
jgi:hypothetical protein